MIDKEKIKNKINIIKENLCELEKMQVLSSEDLSHNIRDLAAAKYFIRTSIEAIIDIGAHIIAKNLLGAPSTNVEIIVILAKRGIIPERNLEIYTKMIKYRNRLTHFYGEVSVQEIYEIIQSHLNDFESFIQDIVIYLDKNKENQYLP